MELFATIIEIGVAGISTAIFQRLLPLINPDTYVTETERNDQERGKNCPVERSTLSDTDN